MEGSGARTGQPENPPCCAILWETNERFGTGAAVKAMLRHALEEHYAKLAHTSPLPSGLFVDDNKVKHFLSK